jgi:HEAT repeat protein
VHRRRTTALLAGLAAALACSALGFEWEGRLARLFRQLESPDPAERVLALQALGRRPAAEVRAPVLRALSDPDASVRAAAAVAAGEARLAAAVPVLVDWLDQPEAEVRALAARTLGAIGDPAAVAPLVRALGDGRAEVRRAAIEALGAIRRPDALVPLIARLDDTDAAARAAAAQALARWGDTRAVVPLIARARDDAPEVRAAVAAAVGDIGDARAVPVLVQALADESIDVQLAATAALGRIGDEDAAQALAVRVTASDDRIARASVAALGAIASPRALAAVIETVARPALAPIAVEALRRRASADGEALPRALAEALDAAESPSRIDALATTLSAISAEVSIAPAAPALWRALESGGGDPTLLLAALGASGAELALFPILERLGAADAEVRSAALRALSRWIDVVGPDGRAADPLIELLDQARARPDERATAARLLGRIGAPRALPSLHALLARGTPAERLAAVEAIGAIGDPAGAEPLWSLLDDRDGAIRHRAARALARTASPAILGALIERLRAPAPADREALLLAIGGSAGRLRRGGKADVIPAALGPLLLELAAHPDRRLASAALAAVSSWAEPTLAAPLAELAARLPASRRGPVAAALGAIDDERARRALRALAEGEDGAALVALSRLGEHGGREEAEWLLGRAGTLPWPRSAAASFAIARLGRRGFLEAGDVPAICALGRSHDPWVRANLAVALAALGAGACEGDGPDPLRWLEPPRSAVVRAAAARWAHAAASRGAIDAARVSEALARCARAPLPGPAERACAAPALPPCDDVADIVAWSADGRTVLERTIVALRLADGTVFVTETDDGGRIQLAGVPAGALALDLPGSAPLEP